MKKIIIIFCAILFTTSIIYPQAGWSLIYTFNNQNIYSIAFKDSLTGFAITTDVGSKIYKTTNGGENWDEIIIPNLNTFLLNIIVVDEQLIFGFGGAGTFIKSSDGGNSWTVKNIGDTLDLNAACSTVDGNLYVCPNFYGKIYKSTDNGNTWSETEINLITRLSGIDFLDTNIGFAVGEQTIKTTDGGENWFQIAPLIDAQINSINFINGQIGYAVGYDYTNGFGNIIKTSDGGNSWVIKRSSETFGADCITTSGENLAWVVGGDDILFTDDAGETWIEQNFFPYNYLFTADALDSRIGFILGGNGSLYKTTSSGLSAPLTYTPPNWSTEIPLNLSLSWSSSTNANLFDVQVALDSGFSNKLIDTILSNKTLPIGPLNLNTIYFWRVKEKLHSIDGPWSTITNFTTTKGAPILISPPYSSINLPLETTFIWSDVTLNANSYQLQVSTDSLFNSLDFNFENIVNSEYYIGLLLESTKYYWRVRTKVEENYGAWSNTWNFITFGKIPSLSFPINNSTNIPARTVFSWFATANTSNYRIQISTDSLFAFFIIDSTTSSTSIEITLNINTKYFWKVGAENSDGQTYWSQFWCFRTSLVLNPPLFPLYIGNKWFYQAGSTGHNFYYGVVKEITDTLGNGFRKVTSKYYYLDSLVIGTEYWAYIDGKFYINDLSTIYFNDYLTQDSCIYYGLSSTCWNLIPYELFNIVDTAQQFTDFIWNHSGAAGNGTTILPQIGIVKTMHFSSSLFSDHMDTTYLSGMYRNGEVLGDTLLNVSVQDSTYFPLNIGTRWYYQLQISYDYNNYDEKIIKEVTDILDSGLREIRSTYFYEDSTINKMEYWRFFNGKFYISESPNTNDLILYYNVDLPDNRICIDTDSTSQCWKWFPNKYVFQDDEFDAQIYEYRRFYFVGSDYKQSIIANKLGPVENRYTVNQSSSIEKLDSISYNYENSSVYLIWPTNNLTELSCPVEFKWCRVSNNLYYELQVSSDSTFKDSVLDYNNLTDTLITISSLKNNSTYYWKVKSLSSIGYEYWSPIWKFSTIETPLEFKLNQNYPNPFNPGTTIKYSIESKQLVKLKIFDILGKVVVTLVNEEQPAGVYNLEFNAINLASGIYFYRLQAGDFVETKKMIFVK